MKPQILVLCTGNSCRSQMAEAYLRYYAQDKAEVYSAGIEAHGVNASAIAIMREDGIDITSHTSDTIEAFEKKMFDFVITVCDHAQERCPIFPGSVQTFHHNFEDPAKAVGSEVEIMQQFRKVRDQIKAYCASFISQHLPEM